MTKRNRARNRYVETNVLKKKWEKLDATRQEDMKTYESV